jgi:hypothetical protein
MKFQLIISVIVLFPSLAWATSNDKVCTPSIVDLCGKGCAHTHGPQQTRFAALLQ